MLCCLLTTSRPVAAQQWRAAGFTATAVKLAAHESSATGVGTRVLAGGKSIVARRSSVLSGDKPIRSKTPPHSRPRREMPSADPATQTPAAAGRRVRSVRGSGRGSHAVAFLAVFEFLDGSVLGEAEATTTEFDPFEATEAAENVADEVDRGSRRRPRRR